MKITVGAMAALLMSFASHSLAQSGANASVYMDREFFVGITVATFKHNESYCSEDHLTAVRDLESLIGMLENKLATVQEESARKPLHFDLVHWYGRLSRVHNRANQFAARDDALKRASQYAQTAFDSGGGTGPDFINRLIDQFDEKYPCKR